MAFCSNCGAEIPEGTKFCPKCGTPVKSRSAADNGSVSRGTSGVQMSDSQNVSGQPVPGGAAGEKGHGLAIGSLVCGIVGVVCWFFGYGSLLSIVLGIIGLVLAGNAKKAGNSEGMRTAGFVLSLIALIGGVIVFLYFVIALAFVGATMQGLFSLLK